jgi:arylsulfatase
VTQRDQGEFGGRIGRTFADSEPWWPPARRARDGAPNIVVVLVDDMGYSDISPFGAEIATPHLDRLADRGVQLTNYHTAAVCSPARAALLTGLNPHRAGFAYVASNDFGFPGYTMELAEDVATLPESLHDAGYATFAVGKWHLARDGALHPAADRRSWPIQRGFDRYYGCLEGLTSLFHPHQLIQDNSPLTVDRYPDDYYLTTDLTDRAIDMLKSLRAHDATQPFFLYVAHHAVHGPIGAPTADVERYRGRYAAGWDALREERFARQVERGLFPPGTRLPERNVESGLNVEPWASLPAAEQARLARYQEVYAAMVDNIDQNLGRLLATIEAFGELDNTIVVFTSDNGGTAEGGAAGTRSYFSQFAQTANPRGFPPSWPRDVARDADVIGTPQATVHYPRGWGMTSNTPFRLYKGQTFAGGVRVPFVISWPAGLPGRGLRHQYQYVTDLHATLLDLAGVATAPERHGQPTLAIDGRSFGAVLHDASAPGSRSAQYAESRGNRGFYRDGWKLLTHHGLGTPYDQAEWQLFDLATDPTETTNVAAAHPALVAELAAEWEAAAEANHVFPLPDRTPPGRRPSEASLQQPVRLLPGTPTLDRFRASRLIAMRSFTADIEVAHAASDAGILLAHGDQGGGYSVYVEEGRLAAAYNEYGQLHLLDGGPLAPGDHQIRLDAVAHPGFRWRIRLLVDGVERAVVDDVAMLLGLSPLEGIDVGIDRRSPVSWAIFERHGPFPYSGTLRAVTYTPGERLAADPAAVARATAASTRVYE